MLTIAKDRFNAELLRRGKPFLRDSRVIRCGRAGALPRKSGSDKRRFP